jgi:hypothetical protein
MRADLGCLARSGNEGIGIERLEGPGLWRSLRETYDRIAASRMGTT